MDQLISPRHVEARKKLFKKFHHILRLRGPLEQEQLEDLGVSTSQLDLDHAENFSLHFLPATAEKLASLEDRRPEMDPKITTDTWYQDCSATDRASLVSATLIGQAINDDAAETDGPCLLDSTRWQEGGYGCLNEYSGTMDPELMRYIGGWAGLNEQCGRARIPVPRNAGLSSTDSSLAITATHI